MTDKVSAEAPAPDLISVLATQSAELTRLTAENERLRAALETVRDEYGYTFPTDTNQMIAAALNEEPRT
jgi:predicted phage gp36 major capsid-like protein